MERLKEVAELKAAFAAWRDRDQDATVKDAVFVVTDTLKAAGWPIEAIVVQLKSLARESHSIARHERLGVKSEDTPMERVVRWAIRRYYNDTPDTAAPGSPTSG